MSGFEQAKAFLSPAGIEINGSNPWDPRVHDERVYDRIFSGGTLAAGESYMDAWWDVQDLAEFFSRLFRKGTPRKLMNIGALARILKVKIFNLQNSRRAYEVGKKHYDIGNALYERMLDSRMIYSCGYWKNAKTLDEAQEHKLDLTCKKIGL